MQSVRNRASRRDILKSSLGALLLTLLPGSPARAARDREANIMDFGAAGDGSRDDTRAFQRALRARNNLYVPVGTYAVTQITISAGKTIRTDGLGTIFKQLPGQPNPTSIIKIVGSNVVLGSLTCVGNIATDQGEWMHAVEIAADQSTGNLSDIILGDLYGKHIRGDVLMLYARPGYALSSISADNIGGDNVFRNVVSICGTGASGGNIRINRVSGTAVGLYHFDIEPDPGLTPAVGVFVGEIRGRNVGVVGSTGDVYADAIAIDSLDLSPSYSTGSSPDYPTLTFVRPHGLQVRNAKSLKIGTFRASGFDGQAIKYIEGDLQGMALDIDSCRIEDCCRTESNYYTYVLGRGADAKISITQLNATIGRDNVSAFFICDGCSVGSVDVSLTANARLLYACPGATLNNLQVSGSGAGMAAISSSDATFNGGSADFATIAYNCDRLQFKNMTISGSFAGGSPTQEHLIENTTLNGTYYASEVYRPFA
jgi:hypothetical protein